MEKDEEFNKKFREAVNKFVAEKNEAAFEVLDRQHSFLSARGVVLAANDSQGQRGVAGSTVTARPAGWGWEHSFRRASISGPSVMLVRSRALAQVFLPMLLYYIFALNTGCYDNDSH